MKALLALVLFTFTVGTAVAAPAPTTTARLSAAELNFAYEKFDAGFETTASVKIAQMTPAQKAAYIRMRSVFVTVLVEKTGRALFCTPVRELVPAQRQAVQAAMVATLLDARVVKAVAAFNATF